MIYISENTDSVVMQPKRKHFIEDVRSLAGKHRAWAVRNLAGKHGAWAAESKRQRSTNYIL